MVGSLKYYTTAKKVQEFLGLGTAFGSGTNPTLETLENIIRRKEDYIDVVTNNTWRVLQTRYTIYKTPRDISPDRQLGIPIFLRHRNIRDFDATQGDALARWDGSSYEDWLSTKTEGRNDDYWIDKDLGILYIVNNLFWHRVNEFRIKYRYGGSETQLDGATLIGATTLTVDSTAEFGPRGTLRLDFEEEVSYTGKTSTTFTGVVRAINNTTAAAYTDNEYVHQIPGDIEEACTKLVAIELLENDDRSTLIAEDSPPNLNFTDKINLWRTQIERILDNRKEMSAVLPHISRTY